MTHAGPTTPPARSLSTPTRVAEPPHASRVSAGVAGRALHPSVVRSIVTGAGAVAAAAIVRTALDRLIGPEAGFLPFGFAVLLTVWHGGSRAGHAASVLAALTAAFAFDDPGGSFAIRIIWFALYLLTGLGITAIIESMNRRQRAIEAHAVAQTAEQARKLDEAHRLASARGESDRAAHQKDAMYRLLVESVADYAIFMLDPNGRVISWNAGAERIKGYTADEIIGRNFSVFYPAEDQRNGKPAGGLRAALRERRYEDDGWRVRKDGTRLWANIVISPVRRDGELLGFANVVRDLTRRHTSDVLLESVLDSAIDGIIGIDENGTIRSFNAAAEAMFDYPAGEVIGLQFPVLMPEPYRSNVMDYLVRHAHARRDRIVGRGRQLIGLRGDGTTFPLELAVSDFILDGRRYFTGVVRDITRQRALEEQLQQAQKMHAIGQLAGGVAHDFNNLLTIIAGHTELLLGRHQQSDELRDALTDIRDAGMRAAGLTRQLLTFSRRAVLDPKILDLNTVVRDAQKMLRRIIGEDVELVTHLAPALRPVSVDQSQIGQVLVNLVVNARDALPAGGRIEIETAACDIEADEMNGPDAQPGRYVRLCVRDNGVGMTPEIAQRIFEPFFTTKDSAAGTGLGLSMVYGIVRQSGGHVDVRTRPGAGTEVMVFLPVAAEPGTGRTPSRTAVRPSVTGTETLLVVEDEESVRRLAVFALREQGYRIIEACNGAEALRHLSSHQDEIDLIVTDVVMPVMGGRQLVESIRSLRPDVRVLYVSGYTDDAVVRHGVQRSEVAFLQKPYTPHELAAKVRRVLDGRE